MFAISMFLFIAFVIGAIVCFEDVIALHPICAEAVQIVWNEKVEGPVFSIPEDMVFFTESSDMDHAFNQLIVELDNEREQDEDRIATWFFWTGDLACTDWATA